MIPTDFYVGCGPGLDATYGCSHGHEYPFSSFKICIVLCYSVVYLVVWCLVSGYWLGENFDAGRLHLDRDDVLCDCELRLLSVFMGTCAMIFFNVQTTPITL